MHQQDFPQKPWLGAIAPTLASPLTDEKFVFPNILNNQNRIIASSNTSFLRNMQSYSLATSQDIGVAIQGSLGRAPVEENVDEANEVGKVKLYDGNWKEGGMCDFS